MCLSSPKAPTPPPPPPPAPPPPVLQQQAPVRAGAMMDEDVEGKGKSKSNQKAKGTKGYQQDLAIPTKNTDGAVGGAKGASGVNVAQ